MMFFIDDFFGILVGGGNGSLFDDCIMIMLCFGGCVLELVGGFCGGDFYMLLLMVSLVLLSGCGDGFNLLEQVVGLLLVMFICLCNIIVYLVLVSLCV